MWLMCISSMLITLQYSTYFDHLNYKHVNFSRRMVIVFFILLFQRKKKLKYFFMLAEILRVSGRTPNQGFSDFDRLQYGSLSPMASSDMIPNNIGTGFNGWNGLQHEVSISTTQMHPSSAWHSCQ